METPAVEIRTSVLIRPHQAICVSLPEWDHSIGFSCQDAELLDALKAGYPRFSLHQAVAKLEQNLVKWSTFLPGPPLAIVPGEAIKLFPSETMAKACQKYLQKVAADTDGGKRCVRVTHVTMDGILEDISWTQSQGWHKHPEEHVYSVTYPDELARYAWKFWLHTGYGVSSRFCAFWLKNATFLFSENGAKTNGLARKLPAREAKEASKAMREHIATLYSTQEVKAAAGDVFLFQGGMAAITQTATSLSKIAVDRCEGRNGYSVAVFG